MEDMQAEASEAASEHAKAADSWSQTTAAQAVRASPGSLAGPDSKNARGRWTWAAEDPRYRRGCANDGGRRRRRRVAVQPLARGTSSRSIACDGARWDCLARRRAAAGAAELPDRAAPIGGGAAAALLVSRVVLARALRREEPAVAQTQRAKRSSGVVDRPGAAGASRGRADPQLVQDLLTNSSRPAERVPSRMACDKSCSTSSSKP